MRECSGVVLIRSWDAIGKLTSMSTWHTLSPWSCWWDALRMGEGPLAHFFPVCGEQVLLYDEAVLQVAGERDQLFLSPCRVEQIGLNATNTFLVYTEEDLGYLLKIKLTWEKVSQPWYNLWKEFHSYFSQSRKSMQELNIRRIRVKSGETQRK